ncbi:Jacalin-like lectin domain-containing protein, partial [Aspergillus varians]
SSDADISARSANLQEVADYIATNSSGNAVLVFGDVNARYTSSGENIRVFNTQEGMADPWVELVMDGEEPEEGGEEIACENPTETEDCEVVDKVFYRGSRALTLEATSWGYEDESFLNNGSVVSDHNPISVEFNWTISDFFRLSDLYGGSNGTWFNDLPTLPSNNSVKATTVSVSGGTRLDNITITLSNGNTTTHGGAGGTEQELTLADDEHWTTTRLCQGSYNNETRIFYIAITTDQGNSVCVGTETDECVEYKAEEGWGVIGALGRSGSAIDMLGVIYGVAG